MQNATLHALLPDYATVGTRENRNGVRIDLGPDAGHDGGRIVFEGTPADLVAARSTLTGEHLAAYVNG